MTAISIFEKVVVHESLVKTPDREQFVAYMILRSKYPDLTYWSTDGYSCDALADYTRNIVWRDNVIVDWSTKKAIKHLDKEFYKCSITEIIDTWEGL